LEPGLCGKIYRRFRKKKRGRQENQGIVWVPSSKLSLVLVTLGTLIYLFFFVVVDKRERERSYRVAETRDNLELGTQTKQ